MAQSEFEYRNSNIKIQDLGNGWIIDLPVPFAENYFEQLKVKLKIRQSLGVALIQSAILKQFYLTNIYSANIYSVSRVRKAPWEILWKILDKIGFPSLRNLKS